MTKFCARKVRMNRPITSTEQMLASASKGVSSTVSSAGLASGSGSVGALMAGVFFFVILGSLAVSRQAGNASCQRVWSRRFNSGVSTVHDVENALPSGKASELV